MIGKFQTRFYILHSPIFMRDEDVHTFIHKAWTMGERHYRALDQQQIYAKHRILPIPNKKEKEPLLSVIQTNNRPPPSLNPTL